jgi:hypothetical protein
MKRSTILLAAFAVLVCLAGIPLFAQHGGGHGGVAGGGSGMGGGAGTGRSDMRRYERMGIDTQGPSSTANKRPAEVLSKNAKLASKLESLLPAGTNLQDAASGFKNFGQFVAAVHVANNLGIPFDQLKNKLVGTGSESLGKAIHDLRPDINGKAEAKKAHKQADADISESETRTSP